MTRRSKKVEIAAAGARTPAPLARATLFERCRVRTAPEHDTVVPRVTSTSLVSIGVPSPTVYVQSYDGPEAHDRYALVHLAPQRADFLVATDDNELLQVLGAEVREAHLVPYVTPSGSLGFWPVQVFEEGQWRSSWVESSSGIAVGVATSSWVRVARDPVHKRFLPVSAHGITTTVDWSSFSFADALERAFPDERVVTSIEHPVVQMLTGAFAKRSR